MSPRVGFFVDGFNLYHGLATLAKESGDQSVKWLDLAGLANGCLCRMQPLPETARLARSANPTSRQEPFPMRQPPTAISFIV